MTSQYNPTSVRKLVDKFLMKRILLPLIAALALPTAVNTTDYNG